MAKIATGDFVDLVFIDQGAAYQVAGNTAMGGRVLAIVKYIPAQSGELWEFECQDQTTFLLNVMSPLFLGMRKRG